VRQGVDVGGAAKRRRPPERARPERDFLALDPEFRVREQAVARPVIVGRWVIREIGTSTDLTPARSTIAAGLT
jgi:hypothetical protein